MPDPVILHIAIPSPLPRLFDYLQPATQEFDPKSLQTGIRVQVPFGNRTLIGFLISTSHTTEFDFQKLKAAKQILDQQPVLPTQMLELVCWAADYYHHPIGECFNSVLPTLLRKGEALQSPRETIWTLSPEAKGLPSNALKSAPKQAQLLTLMQDQPAINKQQLEQAGLGKNIVNALIKKQLLITEEREIQPTASISETLQETPLTLNDEQHEAVTKINNGAAKFGCFLLEGITGSGKTEVYLQAIEATLNRGAQALVLIPEIGLTPQTVSRFRNRFNCEVAVLHSGLNNRERLNGWLAASKGQARIIIGTRSAIFTPMQTPGIIIVDEEHDLSFKQQDGFRYNARDIAVRRAQLENIPVILGSATPSIESLFNASYERYQLLKLRKRAGGASSPSFELLDIRREPLTEGFGETLLSAIKSEIELGRQVLVFINRRGYAPTLMCHDCGWIANCRACDSRLTVHREPPHLHCHHCNHQQALTRQCPQCRGQQLQFLGQGTERSEATLQSLFPDTRVLRVDRDTTQRKSAMQNIVNEVNSGGAMILVGTQMLAKGHHFPNVTLVAIMDVDAGLFSADFRGAERMGQLLTQVAGRAGRAELAGQVLVQTHFPEHPLINTLIQRGYNAFALGLLAERQQQQMPPCSYFAMIRAEDKHAQRAENFLLQLRQLLSQPGSPVTILGPIPAPLHKRAGRYRFQLLLQATKRAPLHHLLKTVRPTLETNKLAKIVRWSIDVDPQDMS